MNYKWVAIFLLFIVAGSLVYGLSGQPHEFSENECSNCHFDTENNPSNLKPSIAIACNTCHPQLEVKKSHPSEIYPTMAIPKDMPLIEGKLTCTTCHYLHPKDNMKFFSKKHFYLRRQVQGVFFCIECHKVDEKGHIVMAKIHTGSYNVTDNSTRIDRMSLECIECHDSHMKEPVSSLGAGKWTHYKKKFNHTIGTSYRQLSMRNMKKYKPENTLNKEMRLYDGKVGCGTCHNIYSKEKNMLAISNRGSKLCLSCHIK